ncbi:hypothetical protein M758_5G124200 [Ceratodon purpureus]|nr:hypothetical protein M758_5G124200 [Ceratodon purpureus]
MESINAGLEIISYVTATADNVPVNKNQCKRLAERFRDISKALEVMKIEHKFGNSLSETSAIDQILTVLEKGQALVESYATDSSALQNVLNRAENLEAFQELHEEIDALGTCIDLGRMEQTDFLRADAEADQRVIVDRAPELILEGIPKDSGSMVHGDVEGDVENMEKAVREKCYNAGSNAEDLSYLNIPLSAIQLDGAIKELKPLSERKTQADAHLDGRALVHKGMWNGCNCAIKVFKSADMHWNTEELHKEIASLVKLRHPHVTQLIGCAEHDNKTYVLYEMMDSDLRSLIDSRMKKMVLPNFLKEKRPFSRAKEVSIITQIARGMFYLHEKGLVHGELKCTNLLVKQRGDHIDVKVADFHCSRQLGQTPTSKYKPAHRPRWMPPEAFQHFNVDQPSDDLLMKGDVYSFAMTCYEVVTGKYPFDGVTGKAVEEKIKAGERPDLPADLSKELKSIITKCWNEDPKQRPSFQVICYLLMVDAVNLVSQFENLFSSCLPMGSVKPAGSIVPVGDIDDGKEWSVLIRDPNEEGTTDIQGIDEEAKNLPHYLKIDPSNLKPARPLGGGASAMVYEASWIGCRFAVKWLKVKHVDKLRKEVSIMMTLLHPHVIRLVGFTVLSNVNRCGIVMELMDKSLRDFMNSRINASKKKPPVPFTESEALSVITKLALGMNFLHSRDVIHGDLKCANVLVRGADSRSAHLDVKIMDFGLSQFLGERSPFQQSGKVVGWWRAPEIIASMESKEHVDIDLKAADVYSFAMVCYEVITGEMPFHGMSYDLAKTLAMAGGRNLDKVDVRDELKRLLKDCWSLNPGTRPKFDTILKTLSNMSA